MKHPTSPRTHWLCAAGALLLVTAVFLSTRTFRETSQTNEPAPPQAVKPLPESGADAQVTPVAPEPAAGLALYQKYPELSIVFALTPNGQPLVPTPTYTRRSLALRRMKAETLSEPLMDEILGYLRQSTGPDKNGRSDLVEAAIKNNLINWLEEQRPLKKELTQLLFDLSNDTGQPVVIRDYALQHLGSWARLVNQKKLAWSPETTAAIADHLEAATFETEHSMAGTALLSLERIGSPFISVLQERATAVMNDPEFSSLSRTTALQLVGRQEVKPVLAASKKILTSESPPELKIAAIHILADHATTTQGLDDPHLLADPRIALALASAKSRIQSRSENHGGEG